MQIDVIAIGNEILKGSTVNTNVAFISKELRKAGYETNLHIVLPDDPLILREQIQNFLNKSDIVIASGGLGPTVDDLTKKVVAEVFESDLVKDEAIEKDLKNRYPNSSSIEEQSTVPRKAKIMKNTVGTAPGFIFHENNKCLLVFPGVPRELHEMFLKEGLGYIQKEFSLKNPLFMRSVYVCKLFEVQVDQVLRKIQSMNDQVALGIYPSLGLVHVTFSVNAENEEAANKNIQPLVDSFTEELKDNIYPSEEGLIEEAVHRFCIDQKITLAFAESCTGGALASRITAMKDASKYFLGSVVSYSNDLKQNLLGVSAKTLKDFGAVSEETVKEMVQGVMRISQADYGVAISGIAGPDGGTKEKPVGTVFIAFSRKNQVYAGCIHARGNRSSVIEYTCNFVFSTLWQMFTLKKGPEFP